MFFSQRMHCGKRLDHLNKVGLPLWNRPPEKALAVFQAVKEKPHLPLWRRLTDGSVLTGKACTCRFSSSSSPSSFLNDLMDFVLDATMRMLLPWPGEPSVSRVVDCWDYSHWYLKVNSGMGRLSLRIIERDSAEGFLFTQSFQLNIPQQWAFIGNSLSDHCLSWFSWQQEFQELKWPRCHAGQGSLAESRVCSG